MRAAILSLIFATPVLAAPVPKVPVPVAGKPLPECPDTALRHATGTKMPGVQRLGDLPPANQYLAVDRAVGGCRIPLVVATGIGTRR